MQADAKLFIQNRVHWVLANVHLAGPKNSISKVIKVS